MGRTLVFLQSYRQTLLRVQRISGFVKHLWANISKKNGPKGVGDFEENNRKT
jgi:hypothetical protein